MECVIKIEWDNEAKVWIAKNDYLPLTIESESLDSLMDRTRKLIPELVELNTLDCPRYIHFFIESRNDTYVVY